jgi:hypothetical protein
MLWFCLLAIAGGLFTIFVCPYLRDMAHFPTSFFALGLLAVLFFYGCHQKGARRQSRSRSGEKRNRSSLG